MQIPNGVAQALVRNDAQLAQADDGRLYEVVVLDAAQAVRTLYSVWDQARTFESWAQSNPFPKASALAAAFFVDAPVIVSGARRAPEAIVVVDGNHRMLALALRAASGLRLPGCVGVLVER